MAVVAVAGAMTLVVTACGGGLAGAAKKKSPAATAGPVKIKIAYTAPVVTQMLPLVTEKAGFFSKYGVTATITYLTASEAEDELATNGVQMVTFSAPEPEGLRSHGYSTEWVATWADITGLELLGAKGVSSVADLATKPVGETAPGSTTAILSQILLKEAGVLTKVHLEPLGSVGAMDAAFEAGSIQGVIGSPPTATKMLKDTPGSSVLVNLKTKKGFKWVGAGMAVIATWASSNKKATVDVMKALVTGDKYMETAKNQTTVLQVIETATKTKPTTAKIALGTTLSLMKKTPSQVPSLSVEKGLLKEFSSVTPKVKEVKAPAVIETTYMKQATKAQAHKKSKQ